MQFLHDFFIIQLQKDSSIYLRAWTHILQYYFFLVLWLLQELIVFVIRIIRYLLDLQAFLLVFV